MTSTLIGLAGRRGSGKDTAAAALDGFENVKMAGGLKAMLAALLAYQGASPTLIERMIEGDLKETPSRLLSGRSPRHAMVTLGTDWGRDDMDEDLWVNVVGNRVAQFDKVVISDIRFPNEAEMVERLGGDVYRIERPDAPRDDHVSESHIDSLSVSGVIVNDCTSADEFQKRVLFDLI